MKRWVVAAVALVGLTGCAAPVAGRPMPGPTSSAASAKPEVVRWMNNFCAVADYMIASGGVTFDQNQTDPAAAKKSVSDNLGRVVDVLNVVLHDLDELTPAPTPAADTAVEIITEPLTRARDKFVSAKSTVDDAPELTTDVFSTVIQDMTEAVTVMQEAVEKMTVVSLPEEFRDAAAQAENCDV
ncbi:hypothetical protein ALI22I_17120 [Saccharothrix sp. ALI-22-I]|uniref:hypothetical protein n=1 Tax=Saccharothrix sp. ALI-22-I TaxID=1933778 RepID=UPI00097C4DE5|nr:hypothetical protein [Saccharothrix sp. ALI-22-I]ONI89216.1 hypothetical protein ALI22I_17120 [Saccharothrix sp. ALI-22-I]